MKRAFAAIWNNVKHGKNIELYVAVLLALVAVFLDLFNQGPQNLVIPLMGAVLAMLAVGLLVQRSQNDRIAEGLHKLEEPPIATAGRFFVPLDMTEIQRRLERASTVYLWGGTLRTDLPLFEDAIKRGMSRGRTYRVLMMKPNGACLNMAAVRWKNLDLSEFESQLKSNLGRAAKMNAVGATGKVEVKVLDDMNPYVMYAFDPHLESGSLIVRLPNFTGDNTARATFWIDNASDPTWFVSFIKDFDAVWELAEEWPSTRA